MAHEIITHGPYEITTMYRRQEGYFDREEHANIKADPDLRARERAEDAALQRVGLYAPDMTFATATRIYFSYPNTLLTPPHDDKDQEAWDRFYPAELQILRDALSDTTEALRAEGITPPNADKLIASRHAGCLFCPCSGGMLTPTITGREGRPLDLYITISA